MALKVRLLLVGFYSFPIAFVPPVALAQPTSDSSLYRGRAALASARVAVAEAAFEAVLRSSAGAAPKVESHVALANVAWRIRRDSLSAAQHLRAAREASASDASNWIEQSRMELDFHNTEAAKSAAAEALARGRGVAKANALLALARAEVITVAEANLEPSERRSRLASTTTQLRNLLHAAPGQPDGSRLLLLAGLLAGDTAAVVDGWRSYYSIGISDTTAEPLRGARILLHRALARWSPQRNDDATEALLAALSGGRFFDEALGLASARDASGSALVPRTPEAKETIAYATFLRDARQVTNEYYRATALERRDEGRWRDSLTQLARGLWPRLVWSSETPKFEFNRLVDEISRRFGAVVRFGQTGGYPDVHFGHVVWNADRQVEQYGHRAPFHFIVLDAMVSNGFLSWMWDGRSSDGGWNAADTVVQVRPAYARAPSDAWNALTDSSARTRADSAIAADSITDLARAASRPVAFFPSTARRLTRIGTRAILDSLSGSGLRGDALQDAFIQELSREILEYSIFGHEGRHAIDASNRQLSAADREYRAKLSQLAFAPRPQLAFDGIIAANIGDQTPHGQASERVLRGYLEWMQAHQSDIRGLDPSKPLLPQLPLLTPEQIRTAARSLDPLH